MPHVEELTLYLTVAKTDCNRLVDGQTLHDDVVARLGRLKQFHFSIITYLYGKNTHITPQSNEELRRTFTANNFEQTGSYIDRNMAGCQSTGHVYSLPYHFSTFRRLGVSFPGGRFDCVRSLQIETWSTVKHGFYKKIAEAFPCIETLSVENVYPTAIEDASTDDAEQRAVSITFPRLRILRVCLGHHTHLQQFLHAQRTHLPVLCELEVEFKQLTTVTKNFTGDEARVTCSHVRKLILNECFVAPEHFHSFFPLL